MRDASRTASLCVDAVTFEPRPVIRRSPAGRPPFRRAEHDIARRRPCAPRRPARDRSAASRSCADALPARVLIATSWRRKRSISCSSSVVPGRLASDGRPRSAAISARVADASASSCRGVPGRLASCCVELLGLRFETWPARDFCSALPAIAISASWASRAVICLVNARQSTSPTCVRRCCSRVARLAVAACLAGLRSARSAAGFPPRRRCRKAAAGSARRVRGGGPAAGFLRFELADAGRLFEDQPPVARRRLQQHVDLALLDDAVGFGGDAGAGEQVADVAQPAGLAVDQILALAAAIDAARDVHVAASRWPAVRSLLSSVSVTSAVPSGPRVGAAVEDDVGHFLAAERLGALRAEDPLDGVDDVGLARAVRARRRSRRRWETRTASGRQSS